MCLDASGPASGPTSPSSALEDRCFASGSREVSGAACSFAVVRHTERSDLDFEAADPMFPFDPTLSKRGRVNASKVGQELATKMDARDSSLTVFCSPFMRCVETAIEICKVFGCGMMIDQAWGEVMAPDLFGGETTPPNATRDIETLVAHARKAAVKVENAGVFVGEKPVYPETVVDARSRYGQAFLSSLERARSTRRSFIIVTHGEALPVCLSSFPDSPVPMGQVPYGGYLIGSLVAKEDKLPFVSGNADDPWLVGSRGLRLEHFTLPVCFAPAAASPTDTDSVKYIVKCLVESCSDKKLSSEKVPVAEKGDREVGEEPKAGKELSVAPPGLAQRLAGKRSSPSPGLGLAARRRVQHAMDLGADLCDLMPPPALLAA
jgi:broad specificity phosphatase PhoE